MYLKLFVTFIILLAVVVGILPYVLHRDDLLRLISFHDFFEVILPILGVGALIKYLCIGCGMGCGCGAGCGCSCNNCSSCSTKRTDRLPPQI